MLDESNIYFLRDLAQTLIEQEKDREALSLLREIVDFFKGQQGEDAGKTIDAKMQLAAVMIGLEMYNEAFSLWAEIAESRKINNGATHPLTLEAELSKVYILCKAGKYQEETSLTQRIYNLWMGGGNEKTAVPVKILCSDAICFILTVKAKMDTILTMDKQDKIVSLFGWTGYCGEMGHDRSFYGLHPNDVVSALRMLADEMDNSKDLEDYCMSLTKALSIAQAAWGDDNEKTREIATRCQHI